MTCIPSHWIVTTLFSGLRRVFRSLLLAISPDSSGV
jgi:hypothetical protein